MGCVGGLTVTLLPVLGLSTLPTTAVLARRALRASNGIKRRGRGVAARFHAGSWVRVFEKPLLVNPLSFRPWLAAKLRLTTAVLLALQLAGPDLRFPVPALRLAGLALQPAEPDLHFPELDLHLAELALRLVGLDLTSTLLL